MTKEKEKLYQVDYGDKTKLVVNVYPIIEKYDGGCRIAKYQPGPAVYVKDEQILVGWLPEGLPTWETYFYTSREEAVNGRIAQLYAKREEALQQASSMKYLAERIELMREVLLEVE